MPVLSADFEGRRLRKRFTRWVIASGFVLIFFWLLPRLLHFYTDWLWFYFDVKYPGVFWTIFSTRVWLGVIFGLSFMALLLFNVWIARRFARQADWDVEGCGGEGYVSGFYHKPKWLAVSLDIFGFPYLP